VTREPDWLVIIIVVALLLLLALVMWGVWDAVG